MPAPLIPQDQWETEFEVPVPGEERRIGPLAILFQKLLNRTERLKGRIAEILGLPWDATPPDTLSGLHERVQALENGQTGTSDALTAHRTAAVLDHPDGSVTAQKLAPLAAAINLVGPDLYWGAANWDTLNTPGVYRVVSGGTGGSGTPPPSPVQRGLLIVLTGATGALSQMFIPEGGPHIAPFIRQHNGTAWTPWAGKIGALPTGTPNTGDFIMAEPVDGAPYRALIGPGVNRIPFHAQGRGLEVRGTYGIAHHAGEFSLVGGAGRWVRLFRINLNTSYTGARGEIKFWYPYGEHNYSSVLAYYVGVVSASRQARLALAPNTPSTLQAFSSSLITDAAIVQTGSNTYELWVQLVTDSIIMDVAWYHQGAAREPHNVLYVFGQAANPPAPISGGLNVRWSNLSSTDQSLGWFGRIVERSSNSNGRYVRYDDGTQVCWFTFAGTGQVFDWVYPAAFVEAPVVQATIAKENTDTPSVINLDAPPTATLATLKRWNISLTGLGEATGVVHLMAIGRWK